VKAGMSLDIRSVASLFVSRSDVAVADRVPLELRNKLGLAIGQETYRAYREILNSPRFQRLENLGARPQRLLFASTGTKDKKASDTLYVDGLAAPNTINTMPDLTLLAFAAHGGHPTGFSSESGNCDAVLDAHRAAGIDLSELAAKLQADGASGFVKSWTELLAAIESKGKAVQ
jgi:transaldolase